MIFIFGVPNSGEGGQACWNSFVGKKLDGSPYSHHREIYISENGPLLVHSEKLLVEGCGQVFHWRNGHNLQSFRSDKILWETFLSFRSDKVAWDLPLKHCKDCECCPLSLLKGLFTIFLFCRESRSLAPRVEVPCSAASRGPWGQNKNPKIWDLGHL